MIQQKIYDMIELTKDNRVPVLLMSNPGYGKTTIVNRYASENGYHVEVLIGSRHSHEDILGYQVNNGGSSLDHINPSWYNRILEKEKEGIPTILFIDELPTSPEYVQGALLSVICDREISVGKPIPDNTIIIAAGNYAENMPDHFTLLSSIVNRFCVVNIKEGESLKNIIDEFLATESPTIKKTVRVNRTDDDRKKTREKVRDMMLNVFSTFRVGSAGGALSLENADYKNIYTAENGAVYNFITPRTMNYFAKMVESSIALSIHDKDTISSFARGLLGRGTNSFEDESQYEKFRESLDRMTFELVKSSIQNSSFGTNYSGNISEDINTFLTVSTTLSGMVEGPFDMIKPIILNIKNKYSVDSDNNRMHEILKNLDTLDNVNVCSLISDLNHIELLLSEILPLSKEDNRFNHICDDLIKICENWEFYKNSLLSEKGVLLTNIDRLEKYYSKQVPVKFNFVMNGVTKDGKVKPIAIMATEGYSKFYTYLVGNSPLASYRSHKSVGDIENAYVFIDGKYTEVNLEDWIMTSKSKTV